MEYFTCDCSMSMPLSLTVNTFGATEVSAQPPHSRALSTDTFPVHPTPLMARCELLRPGLEQALGNRYARGDRAFQDRSMRASMSKARVCIRSLD